MSKEIVNGKKVRVYRNLHKDCFSVVDAKSGRVISHSKSLCLSKAEFRVREAGRQKVLEEKSKNVHAFVCGFIIDDIGKEDGLRPVSYNPYRGPSFYLKDTQEDIKTAFFVKLYNGRDILAKISSDNNGL